MGGTEASPLFVQDIDLLSFLPFERYKMRRSCGVKLSKKA